MGLAIQKIKEIEMPETHAICSPSSYDRWHKCPASAKINATAIQEPSYPATEGTVIHEVAETDLKELIKGVSLEDYWLDRTVNKYGIDVVVTQDLIDCAKFYVAYCNDRTKELQATRLIEEQLELTELHEAIWGTADCLLIADKKIDNLIEVIDFKSGSWPVTMPSNQLKIYGLMALSRYGDEDTKVLMTIVQPRIRGNKSKINSYQMNAEELVDWGYQDLRKAAELCFEDPPVFKAGDWCRFCSYKNDCDKFQQLELRSKL